jgi:RimJ/RimL family protein N-acetyltransferase
LAGGHHPHLNVPVRAPDRVDAGPVLLRRWSPDDAPALLSAVAASIEHLRPWMPWASPEPTLEVEAGFIAESDRTFDEATDFLYGIFSRDDQRSVLGGCGLHGRVGAGALEIGYWVHAAHIRRGYATAAARALTAVALALPGISRVEIHCDIANEASASVPRRLGYRLDRVIDDLIEAPGEAGPLMVWVWDRPLPPDS